MLGIGSVICNAPHGGIESYCSRAHYTQLIIVRFGSTEQSTLNGNTIFELKLRAACLHTAPIRNSLKCTIRKEQKGRLINNVVIASDTQAGRCYLAEIIFPH